MEVDALLFWFWENHRDLPWRKNRTPYGTWISEAMLQQTRVATVLDYYPRFLKHFPDPTALARANEDDVLKLWEGLGYYSRARNLMRGAQYICDHYHGELPASPDMLIKIPGIGPYMANAIASQAFNIPVPAVDGNCIRIFCRLDALPLVPSEKTTYNEIFARASDVLPQDDPGDFNEALMDLGSLICTPKSPRCNICPLAKDCSAALLGMAESFPKKKEKKETPIEEHTILKVFIGRKILVRKRPDKGLLAGLFELIDLPGIMSHHDITKWLSEEFGIDPTEEDTSFDIRVLGPSRHVFSHLRWQMLGYEIHLPSSKEDHALSSSQLKELEDRSRSLGRLVTSEEYQALAFASAIRAYR